MQTKILILTIVTVAVFAICIYAFGRSSKGLTKVVDSSPKLWVWDGDLKYGSSGNWVPRS